MPASWVRAGYPPVVPFTKIHAGALTPVLAMLPYWTWKTFFFSLAVMLFMAYLSYKGRSMTWLVRRVKWRLRGGEVMGRPYWYRRRFTSIESIDTAGVRD